MHNRTEYKFDTEAAAVEFTNKQKENKCPSEDKYIYGPFFMDEDVIFKTMLWASTGKKWWQVTVETYC